MDLLVLRIVHRIREDRRTKNLRIERRELRDKSNPLENLSDTAFKAVYRLTKPIFRKFLDLILPYIQERQSETGLTKEQRVFCALRFFAVGSYQRPIGRESDIAFSQTSVSRTIAEVAGIIDEHLAPQFISFPTNPARKNAIKAMFFEEFGIPGVIGLIDCTHITIKKPPNDVEYAYYSVRKTSHTKNVQVICDLELQILNVNSCFGGYVHDSFVFNNSSVCAYLRDKYSQGERDTWLVGDSGYGQMPWLMAPVANPTSPAEDRYNRAHKKCRLPVERCIGVAKSRFRCICRQRGLMYSPRAAGKIINACFTLHNIMIQEGYPLPSDDEIFYDNDNADDRDMVHIDRIDPSAIVQNGRRLRNDIIRNHF